MDRINEILAELTLRKGKGNQSLVANALGIKPQTFGNYLKGREVPVSLIIKWKDVYGEDLLALAFNGTEKKTLAEMIVSRGNESDENLPEETPQADLHKVLVETMRGVNKLLDQNSSLIAGKDREVERLDRTSNWAFGQIEKLQAKLGIPKES